MLLIFSEIFSLLFNLNATIINRVTSYNLFVSLIFLLIWLWYLFKNKNKVLIKFLIFYWSSALFTSIAMIINANIDITIPVFSGLLLFLAIVFISPFIGFTLIFTTNIHFATFMLFLSLIFIILGLSTLKKCPDTGDTSNEYNSR